MIGQDIPTAIVFTPRAPGIGKAIGIVCDKIAGDSPDSTTTRTSDVSGASGP